MTLRPYRGSLVRGCLFLTVVIGRHRDSSEEEQVTNRPPSVSRLMACSVRLHLSGCLRLDARVRVGVGRLAPVLQPSSDAVVASRVREHDWWRREEQTSAARLLS